jgi:transmembrane sensor
MKPPSDQDSAPEREPTPQERLALRWVVVCDRDPAAAAAPEFAAWLAEDPRHRELFEEFGGVVAVMRRTPELQPAGVRSPRRSWRPALLGGAAAAAVVLGYFGWWRPSFYRGSHDTRIGIVRRVGLPDGSVVELNSDSALAADFSPGERHLRLAKGEAEFYVAKNPRRPFIVEAGGVSVRAVGTAFDVRLRPGAVEVLVTEGKVQVGAAGGGTPTPVAAGQRISVALGALAAGPKVLAVDRQVAHRLLSWQAGRLDFVDATLGEMVGEFNRYNRHQLVIADPVLAAQRFGGTFRLDDPAAFVRMLQATFGVVAEDGGQATILRRER